MYDMYPDAWTVDADRRHQVRADQPRRRPRKEHSVVPAILQARAHKAGTASGACFEADVARRGPTGGSAHTTR